MQVKNISSVVALETRQDSSFRESARFPRDLQCWFISLWRIIFSSWILFPAMTRSNQSLKSIYKKTLTHIHERWAFNKEVKWRSIRGIRGVPNLLEVFKIQTCNWWTYHCVVAAMAKLSLKTECFQSTESLLWEPFRCTSPPQNSGTPSRPGSCGGSWHELYYCRSLCRDAATVS